MVPPIEYGLGYRYLPLTLTQTLALKLTLTLTLKVEIMYAVQNDTENKVQHSVINISNFSMARGGVIRGL